MFYKQIYHQYLNDKKTFISHCPSEHRKIYYKEIQYLLDNDIIRVLVPREIKWDDEHGYVITGTKYEVLEPLKLFLLSKEDEKINIPQQRLRKGKLISIVNELNSRPWVTGMEYIRFDKGRENNNICLTHKNDGTRHFVIDRLFPEGWQEYDIPSSIPQVIYAMNFKKYYGKRVWDELGSNYKEHGMRIIFNVTTQSLAKSLYNKALHSNEALSKKAYVNISKDDDVLISAAKNIQENFERIVGPMRDNPNLSLKERKDLRATYFIDESNIHLLIMQKLESIGIKVVNVYDCFYFSKDVNVEIVKSVIKEMHEYYANNYDEIMKIEESKSQCEQSLMVAEAFKKKINRQEYLRKYLKEHKEKYDGRYDGRYEETKAKAKWQKKVKKWIQENPDKNEPYKKWNDEEKEYFYSLKK